MLVSLKKSLRITFQFNSILFAIKVLHFKVLIEKGDCKIGNSG